MKLLAYVSYPGTCEEALNFYKPIFRGSISEINRYDNSPMASEESKGKVLHTEFSFGDGNTFMACDVFGQEISSKGNITMTLATDDVSETERIFGELSVGATNIMPLSDTFWGAKFGMFTDKFGVNWMFNCTLPQ